MPGKVKVKILAGRNLPVMDRGSDTTDAYVEIKIGSITHKTDVCRKSLHPQWNSDWYRFEIDDADLQDEPLQIRLMDHDTYSANDAIGKVSISLNPLLLPPPAAPDGHPVTSHSGKGVVMAGWIPVFDTMHGIRGEVNVIVKVDLFSDVNKFRQSSCGVHFFHSPIIPHGYHAQVIHGFVDELVVNDDPEYQWIDKIRTPRASNEARQIVFLKLSGQVQRKIGLKALDLGANAVIGYTQCFDLEGDVGVVARGIGTAVTLVKLHDFTPQPNVDAALAEDEQPRPISPNKNQGHHRTESAGKTPQSPARGINTNLNSVHRRSSDSDLSVTPKGLIRKLFCFQGNSLTSGGGERNTQRQSSAGGVLRPSMQQDNLDMLEYPFLTMAKYPAGFIQHLGGVVAARSVKLLERVPNPDEPETRDTWWAELRMEIRSHARALACNVVLGYSEVTTISDDICVLSATGTAAVINLQYSNDTADVAMGKATHAPPLQSNIPKELMTTSLDRQEFENDKELGRLHKLHLDGKDSIRIGVANENIVEEENNTSCTLPVAPAAAVLACAICHIPYSPSTVPFRVNLIPCAVCGKSKVPDVLFSTVEVPDGLPVTGRGCLLQAHVLRPKRDLRSEMNAREISDGLPFLEYELHRLLISKLKVKGMNAIFGLKATVAIGERMIAAVATGTAVFLTALPPPSAPIVTAGNSWSDLQRLGELQRALQETVDKNREVYQLKPLTELNPTIEGNEETEEEQIDLDFAAGNKDTCILEVDDAEDLEVFSLLMEPRPPDGFHVVNTQAVPGLQGLEVVRNLQAFTQVWRTKLPQNQPATYFPQHFQKLLQSVYYKLRCMIPCAICELRFRLDLPEPDEVQLLVTGMALGLGEPSKLSKYKRKMMVHSSSKEAVKKSDDDLIFSLEEEQVSDLNSTPAAKPRSRSPGGLKPRSSYNRLSRHMPLKERYGVDITPLNYVPGGRIDRYLGNLNFFFIRESTSVRENGGISGFIHSFITEILAIVRAHVTALGGNALVAYYMTELILGDNPHKNQGQCLVSVGGDVVFVSYYPDE